MKRTITPFVLCLVLITSTLVVKSQNLVPNPGFEVQDSCPLVSQLSLAKPWFSPTLGSPDLFNSTCPSQNHPARTGIGCSGFFVFSGDSGWENNREYIEAPLTSALQAGKTYAVSFWVQPANFKYAVNKIGAYFSQSLYVDSFTTSNLPFTAQVENPASRPLTDATWTQVTGSFVAAGGESYIIIGNLEDDAFTSTYIYNSSSPYNDSYYYIDDISVTESSVGIDEQELAASFRIFPNPATGLVALNFPSSATIQLLQLLNATGEIMMSSDPGEQFPDGYTINIQNYPSGIYYLSVIASDRAINKKLMIIH